MKRLAHTTAFMLAVTLSAASPRAQDRPGNFVPGYWPTTGWRTSSPEAQGVDSRVLAKVFDFVREQHVPIHDLVIVRNGWVVLDASFYPYHAGDLHDLASATKSVTTTLVGVAIGQGKITSVSQPVLSLFPGRAIANINDRKRHMTVEHLLTMTSGQSCDWMHGELTLSEMQKSADWTQFVLDRPMATDPGSTFAYCSPGMHLLSSTISRVTGTNARAFAMRELFQPLGIADAAWPEDPQGTSTGWGDLHLRPRDMAKLGLLWLAGGRWDGRQIVPADWLTSATRQHTTTMTAGSGYGYGFWIYPDRVPTVFEALGRGGQRISVVPAKNLVVVMNGGGYEPGDIGNIIGAAINSDTALPENPAAKAALDAAVEAATNPPAPRPASAVPAIARAISGRRFTLDANALGLTAFSLSVRDGNEADLTLEFGPARVERRSVGLDGVPRVSPGGRFGLPVAVTGDWERDRFVLVYDEIANINCYVMRLTFAGKGVTIDVNERTGLVRTTIHGRME